MTENGILVIQFGVVPSIHDPNPSSGNFHRREQILSLLENHPQTKAVFVYEEPHVGFEEPTSFLIVCKSETCRSMWYSSSHAVDYLINTRLRDSHGTDHPLVHYDGSAQYSYQFPSRGWETVYCKREPIPHECQYRGLDLNREVYDFDLDKKESSSFEVVKNETNQQYGLVATTHIPKGSYILADTLSANYIISQKSIENLESNTNILNTGKVSVIKDFLDYVKNHGKESIMPGLKLNHVEVSWSSLITKTSEKEQANIGPWMDQEILEKIPVYSPVFERHYHSYDVFLIATKDIEKGEELKRFG